eukprot:TRINITY_DN37350_c0_g1_i1.p1 TRINITY_DN37350_c0_g1~~TRINITY_DN37350_c0_g1_i1.p1  ORF type:complete len:497 (+),score=80.95 TRINITY_DN37350_c0_g1_i1:71-1561(+)
MAYPAREDPADMHCPSLDLSFSIGIARHLKPVSFHFKVAAANVQLKFLRALGDLMDAANCCQDDCQQLEWAVSEVRGLVSKWSDVKPSSALSASSIGELPPLRSRPRTEGELPLLREELQRKKVKDRARDAPFRPPHRPSDPDDASGSSMALSQEVRARKPSTKRISFCNGGASSAPDLPRSKSEDFQRQPSQEEEPPRPLADQLSNTDSDCDSSDDAEVPPKPGRVDCMDFAAELGGGDILKMHRQRRPEFGGRRLSAREPSQAQTAPQLGDLQDDPSSNSLAGTMPLMLSNTDSEDDADASEHPHLEEASRSAPPAPESSKSAPPAPADGDEEQSSSDDSDEDLPVRRSGPPINFAKVTGRLDAILSGQDRPRFRGRNAHFRDAARPQTDGQLLPLPPDADESQENGAGSASQGANALSDSESDPDAPPSRQIARRPRARSGPGEEGLAPRRSKTLYEGEWPEFADIRAKAREVISSSRSNSSESGDEKPQTSA